MAYLGAGITRFNTADGLTVKGTAEFTDTVVLGDSDELRFGAGEDLKIYHDASNSYIQDAGTGALIIRSNSFQAKSADNTTTMFTGAESGAVELYYNNVKRIETTGSGATVTGGLGVTGSVTADGGDGGAKIGAWEQNSSFAFFGSANMTGLEYAIITEGTNTYVGSGTGGATHIRGPANDETPQIAVSSATVSINGGEFVFNDTSGDHNFRVESNNNANMLFVDGGNDRVGIGTASPSSGLHLSGASTSSARMTFTQTTASATGKIQQGSTAFTISSDGALPMTFDVNGAERARIDSSGDATFTGYVGAEGGNAPTGGFHIKDTGGTTRPRITNDASNATVIRAGSATGNVKFNNFANTTELVHITDSGLVGIGVVPSGTAKLQVNGQIYASSDGSASAPAFAVNDGDTGMFRPANNNLAFTAGGTERLRLGSSGNLHLNNATADSNGFTQGFVFYGNNEHALICRRANSNGGIVLFRRDSNNVGSISVTTSATAYNTSSDHRLKENVADMTGAIDRVKALAPKRFNFIADDTVTVDGFLAHEAQAVVPEAVTGTHNEVDEDGNAVMQGIDQSKLVPLLTGALQEAIAKIETLETEVAALKAAN